MRPVYDRTGGADGYVSLELPPPLSHDTAGSVRTAKEYWHRVDRPNLMVKVPATPRHPRRSRADRRRGQRQRDLIFALEAYEKVITAYIGGLQRRHGAGQSLDVHSVPRSS